MDIELQILLRLLLRRAIGDFDEELQMKERLLLRPHSTRDCGEQGNECGKANEPEDSMRGNFYCHHGSNQYHQGKDQNCAGFSFG
jgi:hypothetical protein